MRKPARPRCRMDSLLVIIGDQWTLSLIHKLSTGPKRSLELYAAFKGMSTKTLSTRLHRLVRAGIISRKSYPERPPRVEFTLTEKGRELLPVLQAIASVADRWSAKSSSSAFAEPCEACLENVSVHEQRSPSDGLPEPVLRDYSVPKKRKKTDVTLL